MKRVLINCFILLSVFGVAQNDLSWKNRKPNNSYWQQDVQYKIKAKIDEDKLTVGGEIELVYTNNSPDSLKEVYFHVYQNAFQKGSYYHNLQVENGKKPWYGLYESKGLGTSLDSLACSKGIDSIIMDNTLIKVLLKKAIQPHESVVFDLNFKTYWGSGSTRRRMKAYYVEGKFVHFNGAHWYPRMAVYDQKFGWDTNQHLDKEFYGDFGTFDVELDFANDYIVEATGELQNEQDVLPKELKEKLHISNYYHRGSESIGDTLSIPIKRIKGERKVWKYHAENVHDFAFTADPTFRLDEKEWKGIKVIAAVEERHCPKWKSATTFALDVIKVYSTDFGMYQYPKMVVADANDGMEYPMITFDGGSEPYFKGLFAHEIAHNWFYGMVGSNETYRAMMDEGFTQFLTVWSLVKIDGAVYQPYTKPSKHAYVRRFYNAPKSIDLRAYLGYLNSAVKREDPPLNTHSSDFDGGSLRHGGGYGQVYSKTAVMLYNLQYVLGDSLFLNSMKHYFNQWMFAHPYPEDFRKSIISYTKVDVNWFFDQWMETSKVIDYKIKKVKKLKGDTFKLTFERLGEMQMPIDFTVYSNYDSVQNYHIPNTWFVKETSAEVLPKWYGWGKLNPEYSVTIVVPGGIDDLVIDPTGRLADVNPLNNSKIFPYTVEFNSQLRNYPDKSKYEVKVMPDVWYNKFDGTKIGANIKGGYLNLKHKFNASIWLNTSLGQGAYDVDVPIGQYDDLSFDLKYQNVLSKYAEKFFVKSELSRMGGLQKVEFSLNKRSHDIKHFFRLKAKSMARTQSSQFIYALYENEWNLNKANNVIDFDYNYSYKGLKGKGKFYLKYRTSAFLSDYSYDYVTVENKFQKWWRKFYLKTRLFGFAGQGSNWAPESQLFLAGANPEEISENKFTRAEGVFQKSHTEYGDNINLFHAGGGLNLRGYSGYYSPELYEGNIVSSYKGQLGFAVNIEAEFQRYLGLNQNKFKKYIDLKSYAFFDAGVINVGDDQLINTKLATPRFDSGLGLALTIKKFYHFETTKPVTIRADFPLYLNRTPNVSPDNFQFRWVMGVNRAF